MFLYIYIYIYSRLSLYDYHNIFDELVVRKNVTGMTMHAQYFCFGVWSSPGHNASAFIVVSPWLHHLATDCSK